MKRLLAGLLFAALAGCHASSTGSNESSSAPNAAIEIGAVSRGHVERIIETYGTVEFASDRQRSVAVIKPGQVLGVAVIAGQTVKKGDTLLTVGPMPSGSPEVQQARIEAEFAKRELARVQHLVDEKLATNQDLQNAEKQSAAAVAGLRALGGGGAGGARLRASMDGVVAAVLVQRGDVVPAGKPAVVLAAGRDMTVRAGFEVENLAELEAGLTVWLEPVYRGPRGARVKARLSTMHRVVDPATQLVQGVINVPAAPDWMATGLAVRVDVVVQAHDNAVRIPREALLDHGGKTGVYVIDKGHAHWKEVTLGIRGQHLVEVEKGLSPGQHVATVGRSSLADGMAVRISKPSTDGS